jgi:hypothetical protein
LLSGRLCRSDSGATAFDVTIAEPGRRSRLTEQKKTARLQIATGRFRSFNVRPKPLKNRD